jgi:methylmalonyl-CoA mutase
MSQNREKLFSDFHAPTTQEWLDKIQVDLKGADFQKKLVWRTNEGFNVQPFYRREDLLKLKTPDSLPGEFPFVRGNKKNNNTWFVRQNILCDDAKEANVKALDILNKGVDSLGFDIPRDKVSADYIGTLLDHICAECVELNFTTCKHKTLELADILVEYFHQKNYDPAKIHGSIDFDPIEKILIKGKDTTQMIAIASQLVDKLQAFPEFRCVTVNAVTLNNSGAYIVQELGYALAWGNEYLQQLTDAGINAGTAGNKMKFNMGISANYFMEIAKFRAARILWANIVKKYQPECDCTCKMVVNASTSEYNMTIFDSYVNLLRSQTESMSAALAGVDSIVVTPFDVPYEQPTEFSERIARNQQLLLREECHFDKIVDVSAGSYYIEELTNSIANEAWKIFLSVEEEGGFLEAVKKGTIQDAINATNKKRHEAVGKRKEFLLGTNQFPNFTEKSDGKEPKNNGSGEDKTSFKKIESSRLASDFEALRTQTEKSGKTPTAFMLTIGKLVWRQARAQFSANFLACAGYKIIDNLGFDTVEQGVDAALEAKADIVVLCSSDEEYATYAIPAFRYLNGRAMYIVAGAPECMDELKAAGIENFVHVRCDVLETLKEYNVKLGIK